MMKKVTVKTKWQALRDWINGANQQSAMHIAHEQYNTVLAEVRDIMADADITIVRALRKSPPPSVASTVCYSCPVFLAAQEKSEYPQDRRSQARRM